VHLVGFVIRIRRTGNKSYVLELRASDYVIEFSTDDIEIFLVWWSPISGIALFVSGDAQATAVCLSDKSSVWPKEVTVQWWNDTDRGKQNYNFFSVAYRGGWDFGVSTPPPPKFRRPSKIVPNSIRFSAT